MSSEPLQPLQGMSDLHPPEIYLWQRLEETARGILDAYAFAEVRTPLLERVDLFARSIGNTTDIVQKEMYAFTDRGGRDIALRPEGTAGIIRHVAAGGAEALDSRIYYLGPMFRAERPQAGRKRQFHQLGVEGLGEANPAADAEMIALQLHLLNAWGLKGSQLQLNTRGLPEDQQRVQDGLREALAPFRDALSEDSRRRYDENILRVLDSKDENDRRILENIPPVTEFMGEEAKAYLGQVIEYLGLLDIPYLHNPRLVRGLDYYMHTVWEITHPALGAQDALSGGGRYRITLGKKSVDGVGFAMGLERVIATLQESGTDPSSAYAPPDVWLVSLGEAALKENLVLSQSLRLRGLKAGLDLKARSMKAQMRAANRAGARYVIIRGEDEIDKGTFLLKSMEEGTQEELDMPAVMERLLALRAMQNLRPET